jgi:hypothetical protein
MIGTRLLSTAALLVLAVAPVALAQTSTTTIVPGSTVVAPAPSAGSTVVVPAPSAVIVQPSTTVGSGTSMPGSRFGVTTDCATVSGATSGGLRGTTTSLDCSRLVPTAR